MKLEKNDAWAVANEEIKTLQEIIQDANAKLQNQESELRREQARGNELEQKIYEAQIKARFKKEYYKFRWTKNFETCSAW